MTKRIVTAAPRKLGRPPAADSAETRQRLLSVARLAFATVGYDATTNRDMAAEVGITSAAIYHYFPSKAELYVAVYEQVNELVYRAFEKAVATSEVFIERFGAILDAAVELNREDPSLAAFVVGLASESQRHPDVAEMIRPLTARRQSFLHSLICHATARGEIVDGLDVEGLEDLLNSVLSGLARLSNVTGSAERHRRAVEVLKAVLAGEALVTSSSR